MSRRPRGRSLFWTISGLFLLAVVLGTLLQALLAVAVLRPLEERDSRARAEVVVANIAAEIATAPLPPGAGELEALLARHRGNLGPHPPSIVYRATDGHTVSNPRNRQHIFERLLAGESLPAPPEGEGRGGGAPPRLDILARRPVLHGGERLGEVLVIRPMRPREGRIPFELRTVLLFLPIALIASIVVGFLLVRILVRRLRAIEILAARVAEGDLTVRIGDPSGDEIGRLAGRLDRMTERLLDARTRIEENEQQRRQLFADITHELATPLTSIRGYAETLLDPGVAVSEEERARYVRGVLEESRRLDRLIRDLFELTRLEAGASALTLESLDWAALCRNTVERFEPRFRDAGLRLEWRGSPSPAWIEADGHRMEQVLENLLANALRYVPSGGTVELALAGVQGRDDRFRLTVSDDGPGLSPDDLSHAFERFYRAAGARGAGAARDGGGSGLGLAIVREIVERHGGAVSAETRAPHGLAIVIELPARS